MTLTCFNSSDPAAINSTLLFDQNRDDGNLWERNGGTTLPNCTQPYPFEFRCFLCKLFEVVYVICSNLTSQVSVTLEDTNRPVDILRSGGSTEQQGISVIVTVSIVLLLGLLFIIAVMLYYRRQMESPSGFLLTFYHQLLETSDRHSEMLNLQADNPPESQLLLDVSSEKFSIQQGPA
ncbi:unnamed protein product [Menidia menidia]|uniref:(Atlantic silverside) hypothetical protein n=1 Tax=Menidia menidia TaxID=238744 RepID=A0A8S4A8L7_9TELE|nr:unnamed protein product [Menidia menidia]